MAKFGKKYQDALKLIEADKFYALLLNLTAL